MSYIINLLLFIEILKGKQGSQGKKVLLVRETAAVPLVTIRVHFMYKTTWHTIPNVKLADCGNICYHRKLMLDGWKHCSARKGWRLWREEEPVQTASYVPSTTSLLVNDSSLCSRGTYWVLRVPRSGSTIVASALLRSNRTDDDSTTCSGFIMAVCSQAWSNTEQLFASRFSWTH